MGERDRETEKPSAALAQAKSVEHVCTRDPGKQQQPGRYVTLAWHSLCVVWMFFPSAAMTFGSVEEIGDFDSV